MVQFQRRAPISALKRRGSGTVALGVWNFSSFYGAQLKNQRLPSPPPSAARCAVPRSPRSSFGPAFLFGGAGSYVRVAAPRIYAVLATSYGVTPARRTTRRLRFRRVRRALPAQTYHRADLPSRRRTAVAARPVTRHRVAPGADVGSIFLRASHLLLFPLFFSFQQQVLQSAP